MNVLYATAAVVAVIAAAGYSQRGDNWRARARYWHRVTQQRDRVIERHEARIRRLETALGRRSDHWLPAHHTPPVPKYTGPTQVELDLWLTVDGQQARYQRYPYAEYQPRDDQVRHRQPRTTPTARARALRRAS